MSMPSSSDEVATRQGRSPDFRASSISTRASRLTEPWWARAIGSSASSFSRSASRSASRRLLTKTRVERCAAHQLEQLGVDGRPDRARAAVGGALDVLDLDLGHAVGLAQVLDRHDDPQVELLAHAGVDDGHRAVAADQPGDLVERPLGGRQGDPLGVALALLGQPLERQHQVRAALGGGHGVDLVDDHALDAGQHLPLPRRQHEVEALGGGDEDVGRLAQHPPARVLRRVAGAHRRPSAPAAARRGLAASALIPASGPRRLRSTS